MPREREAKIEAQPLQNERAMRSHGQPFQGKSLASHWFSAALRRSETYNEENPRDDRV